MKIPSIRPHSSGNLRVTIDGKTHYLGKSKEAAEKRYRELMADHFAAGGAYHYGTGLGHGSPHAHALARGPVILVSDLLRQFRAHQQEVCSPRWWDKKTLQLAQMEGPAAELYGSLDVAAFGPRCFHAVRAVYAKGSVTTVRDRHGRESKVVRKRSRGYVNSLARKLRQAFKWGSERELVPVEVVARLAAVPDIRPREYGLEDNEEVELVEWERVEATLEYLSERNADVVRLLWETAMRPDELLRLRVGEVGGTLHRLRNHKTERFNKRRVVAFNARALEILRRREEGKATGSLIFDWLANSHALYTAVQRACRAGGIEPWFPYQLRHAAVTRVALAHGEEVAAAVAGHSSVLTTRRYDHGAEARAKLAVG